MRAAEKSFRLAALDERMLVDDELGDLPVQLRLRGRYLEPVDGVEVAEIEVRFDSAELADLVAQGRAVQLTLAQRARRNAEAVADAAQLVQNENAASDDTGTLQRVVGALYALPDEGPGTDSSPSRGGPQAGGSANENPMGGGVRDAG